MIVNIKKILLVHTFALLAVACSHPSLNWRTHVYTVRGGDTLYAIAWRYQLDYKELAKWNQIKAPYRIYSGQELILVEPDELPQDMRPVRTPRTANINKSKVRKLPSTVTSRSQQRPTKFRWPTAGKVVRRYKGSKSTSQGIDIEGRLGQDIVAAADGKVVYSGSGLTGYGNLLIVKHSEEYLSAYAHNKKLIVREGDKVKAGQVIAKMGLADANSARLHFEVRKRGVPVDPFKYLPAR